MKHTNKLLAVVAGAFAFAGLSAQAETLRLGDFQSTSHIVSIEGTVKWMKAVTQATDGAITFEHFPSQQAAKSKAQLDAVNNGILDAALLGASYHADALPLNAVVGLPGYYSSAEQGTATLSISGQVDSPQIKVTSDPPRPSEEALALLLFGDNIQDISPLALARLASSALTLSGRGGGAQKALRDSTGADNVDIGADNLGIGQLGLGGYLADNVYTDLNITSEGDSELTINLDLTKSLTVTGKADSEGETGLGVFFKRDY